MPIYEYRCERCGERLEVMHRYADPPPAACPACGGPLRKLVSAPAFQFKGSGWYVTDYARKAEGGGADTAKGDAAKGDTAKGGGAAEGGGAGEGGAKPPPAADAKPGAAPSAGAGGSPGGGMDGGAKGTAPAASPATAKDRKD